MLSICECISTLGTYQKHSMQPLPQPDASWPPRLGQYAQGFARLQKPAVTQVSTRTFVGVCYSTAVLNLCSDTSTLVLDAHPLAVISGRYSSAHAYLPFAQEAEQLQLQVILHILLEVQLFGFVLTSCTMASPTSPHFAVIYTLHQSLLELHDVFAASECTHRACVTPSQARSRKALGDLA